MMDNSLFPIQWAKKSEKPAFALLLDFSGGLTDGVNLTE